MSHYFALGDSVSTDDYPGEGKGAASLFWKNADHLYPDFTTKDLRTFSPGIEFHALAADGATSADVLHQQLPALPRSGASKVLFTLTAGGNDILTLQSDAEEIIQRLNIIVANLQNNFPGCYILIGTIYDPTDGEGDLMEPGVPLDREMEILRKVNGAIRSMVAGNVLVIDIHEHFLGHGSHSKDSTNRHYHKPDPSLWYVLNIEPNSRGAHEIRKLFWAALRMIFPE